MYYGMPSGRLPYGLGGIFDDIAKFADKVGGIADTVSQAGDELSQVQSGKKKVALIPTTGLSVTVPYPGKPYGINLPVVPLLAGVGLLAYLALRKR